MSPSREVVAPASSFHLGSTKRAGGRRGQQHILSHHTSGRKSELTRSWRWKCVPGKGGEKITNPQGQRGKILQVLFHLWAVNWTVLGQLVWAFPREALPALLQTFLGSDSQLSFLMGAQAGLSSKLCFPLLQTVLNRAIDFIFFSIYFCMFSWNLQNQPWANLWFVFPTVLGEKTWLYHGWWELQLTHFCTFLC